jgi:hypothetical protein
MLEPPLSSSLPIVLWREAGDNLHSYAVRQTSKKATGREEGLHHTQLSERVVNREVGEGQGS